MQALLCFHYTGATFLAYAKGMQSRSAYLLRRQKKRSVRMLPTIRLGKYLFERNGSILTLPQYTMTLSQAQKDPDLPTLIKLLPRVQANDKGSEYHISVCYQNKRSLKVRKFQKQSFLASSLTN